MSMVDTNAAGAGPGGVPGLAAVPVVERGAWRAPGAVMLPVSLAVIAGGCWLVSAVGTPLERLGAVAVVALGALIFAGLTAISPGQARVVALFGRYLGTVRASGLQWVNPFAKRLRVSTRIRNHETATLKVNDADGNPVEMAAVVVWKAEDTAKAVFAVEDVVAFVATQTETAVRHVAGRYPYDARGEERLSLRENADEITSQLSAEITARVASAGVTVVESRITRLSYASEIAQAMLRRQQADAVVSARYRLVEGAVGMVRLALDRLAAEDLVDLDDERKAAMVSNLLVVLCSDHATQPVVNTGTLYQ
jgi:regulator of protease activity HflC (stomatin/prohibitin superfamily)